VDADSNIGFFLCDRGLPEGGDDDIVKDTRGAYPNFTTVICEVEVEPEEVGPTVTAPKKHVFFHCFPNDQQQ
jgi:hypothetical protein